MPENIQKELKKLFKKHSVLEIPYLQRVLHGRSERSLFRDLKAADSISSYSHAGRFYTLRKIPRFDNRGLWLFNDVGFSRYGTLGATIEHWVNHSAAGYTYSELKERLAIRIENVLLDLTEKKRIRRAGEAREYVYYSMEEGSAALQRKHREELTRQQQVEISERIVIEVLAAVIRGSKVCVELGELQGRLHVRGISLGMRQIAQILERYDVKKTLVSK